MPRTEAEDGAVRDTRPRAWPAPVQTVRALAARHWDIGLLALGLGLVMWGDAVRSLWLQGLGTLAISVALVVLYRRASQRIEEGKRSTRQ